MRNWSYSTEPKSRWLEALRAEDQEEVTADMIPDRSCFTELKSQDLSVSWSGGAKELESQRAERLVELKATRR